MHAIKCNLACIIWLISSYFLHTACLSDGEFRLAAPQNPVPCRVLYWQEQDYEPVINYPEPSPYQPFDRGKWDVFKSLFGNDDDLDITNRDNTDDVFQRSGRTAGAEGQRMTDLPTNEELLDGLLEEPRSSFSFRDWLKDQKLSSYILDHSEDDTGSLQMCVWKLHHTIRKVTGFDSPLITSDDIEITCHDFDTILPMDENSQINDNPKSWKFHPCYQVNRVPQRQVLSTGHTYFMTLEIGNNLDKLIVENDQGFIRYSNMMAATLLQQRVESSIAGLSLHHPPPGWVHEDLQTFAYGLLEHPGCRCYHGDSFDFLTYNVEVSMCSKILMVVVQIAVITAAIVWTYYHIGEHIPTAQWTQTQTDLIVVFDMFEVLEASDIAVHCSNTTCIVHVTSGDYFWEFGLYEELDPWRSSYSRIDDKLLLQLKKKVPGFMWPEMQLPADESMPHLTVDLSPIPLFDLTMESSHTSPSNSFGLASVRTTTDPLMQPSCSPLVGFRATDTTVETSGTSVGVKATYTTGEISGTTVDVKATYTTGETSGTSFGAKATDTTGEASGTSVGVKAPDTTGEISGTSVGIKAAGTTGETSGTTVGVKATDTTGESSGTSVSAKATDTTDETSGTSVDVKAISTTGETSGTSVGVKATDTTGETSGTSFGIKATDTTGETSGTTVGVKATDTTGETSGTSVGVKAISTTGETSGNTVAVKANDTTGETSGTSAGVKSTDTTVETSGTSVGVNEHEANYQAGSKHNAASFPVPEYFTVQNFIIGHDSQDSDFSDGKVADLFFYPGLAYISRSWSDMTSALHQSELDIDAKLAKQKLKAAKSADGDMQSVLSHASLPTDNEISYTELQNGISGFVANEDDIYHLSYVPGVTTDMVDMGDCQEEVLVHIYMKNIKPASVVCTFHEKCIDIRFQTNNRRFMVMFEGTTKQTSFIWNIPLAHSLIPEECNYQVKEYVINLDLIKRHRHQWKSFQADPHVAKSFWQWMFDSDTKVSLTDNLYKKMRTTDDVKGKISTGSSRSLRGLQPRVKRTDEDENYLGMTGLVNNGNTCFMNSVIQILANIDLLRAFCIEGHFKKDINQTSAFGLKGKMATAFAALLTDLWSGKHAYIDPGNLKDLVSKKAPRFCGYEQHDAQEFMTFLLDILHEDLNRVEEKHYTRRVEVNGRPLKMVIQEALRIHKIRDDSFITDSFNGLFKSTVICPTCAKISETLEAFNTLCLPIPPGDKCKIVHVMFMPENPAEPPVKYAVRIALTGTILDLKEEVSKKTGVHKRDLRVMKICNHDIGHIYGDKESLANLDSHDLLIVAEVISHKTLGEEIVEIYVIQKAEIPVNIMTYCYKCFHSLATTENPYKCQKCYNRRYCSRTCMETDWPNHQKYCHLEPESVGHPFIISLPKSMLTYSNLCNKMIQFARLSVDIDQLVEEHSKTSDSTETDYGIPSSCLKLIPSDPENLEQLNYDDVVQDKGDQLLRISYQLLNLLWVNSNMSRPDNLIKGKKLVFIEDESMHTQTEEASVSLEECLRQFTKPEKLAPEHAWRCPVCKELKEATKQLSICRMPNILIIQIKRFNNIDLTTREKITTYVDFPVRDMHLKQFMVTSERQRRWSSTGPVYDLFGVINHYGHMGGGHYVAFARNPDIYRLKQKSGIKAVSDDMPKLISSIEEI